MSLVGRGRLFVDGKLIANNVPNNKQTPGPRFMSLLVSRQYIRMYLALSG